jgi:hypothetical protein
MAGGRLARTMLILIVAPENPWLPGSLKKQRDMPALEFSYLRQL